VAGRATGARRSSTNHWSRRRAWTRCSRS
jgi:hypothetical protein